MTTYLVECGACPDYNLVRDTQETVRCRGCGSILKRDPTWDEPSMERVLLGDGIANEPVGYGRVNQLVSGGGSPGSDAVDVNINLEGVK